MRNQQHQRRLRSTGIAVTAFACMVSCGKGAPSDGATALGAFRGYVTEAFSEKNSGWECDLRTDVRATQGVAEPWEGILRADIFVLEKNGKRNPFAWKVDAVFDRAGSTWTCSPTKSKSAAPMQACETLERFCRSEPPSDRKEKSPPDVAAPPTTATIYPNGWEDLPSYGAALVEYADREWGCVTKRLSTGEVVKSCTVYRNAFRFSGAELAITLRTATGTPARDATLTFTPSNETGYAEALADIERNAKRPPDAKIEHDDEAGTTRTACWHDKDSTTSIASAYALARGSIITVAARDPQRCAK